MKLFTGDEGVPAFLHARRDAHGWRASAIVPLSPSWRGFVGVRGGESVAPMLTIRVGVMPLATRCPCGSGIRVPFDADGCSICRLDLRREKLCAICRRTLAGHASDGSCYEFDARWPGVPHASLRRGKADPYRLDAPGSMWRLR